MRVFLTGATGFIGSAIVPGTHQRRPSGPRPDAVGCGSAGAHSRAGAEVHRGTLEDLESLRSGAAQADGVIHCAFDHDFSNFVANCEKDRRAIEALGAALDGSDRPLVITSGTGMGNAAHGQPATEDVFNRDHPNPRIASELAGAALLAAGRQRVGGAPSPGPRHGQAGPDHPAGRRSRARRASRPMWATDSTAGRRRMSSTSPGSTGWRWRSGQAGARYHAVAEEGIPVRDIAEVIGRGLKVPVVALSQEEAAGHFGWLAMFAGMDHAGFERADAGAAGMAPDRPRTDRRSRTDALLRYVKGVGEARASQGICISFG